MTWHTDPSPEAARAAREGDARRRMYAASRRCTLARNATRAIIKRPSTDYRKHQREVAAWIAENLPEYQFRGEPERNWWEGPLETLPETFAKLKEHDMVTLSDGAQKYLEEVQTNGKESNIKD